MAQEPQTLAEAVRYFSDPAVCHDFVANSRWPNGVACPHVARCTCASSARAGCGPARLATPAGSSQSEWGPSWKTRRSRSASGCAQCGWSQTGGTAFPPMSSVKRSASRTSLPGVYFIGSASQPARAWEGRTRQSPLTRLGQDGSQQSLRATKYSHQWPQCSRWRRCAPSLARLVNSWAVRADSGASEGNGDSRSCRPVIPRRLLSAFVDCSGRSSRSRGRSSTNANANGSGVRKAPDFVVQSWAVRNDAGPSTGRRAKTPPLVTQRRLSQC